MRSAILLIAVATSLVVAETLDTLYEKHDLFCLRNAMSQADAPRLYRGAVAYAFHDLAKAEKYRPNNGKQERKPKAARKLKAQVA
jgi:hypothetical protein